MRKSRCPYGYEAPVLKNAPEARVRVRLSDTALGRSSGTQFQSRFPGSVSGTRFQSRFPGVAPGRGFSRGSRVRFQSRLRTRLPGAVSVAVPGRGSGTRFQSRFPGACGIYFILLNPRSSMVPSILTTSRMNSFSRSVSPA